MTAPRVPHPPGRWDGLGSTGTARARGGTASRPHGLRTRVLPALLALALASLASAFDLDVSGNDHLGTRRIREVVAPLPDDASEEDRQTWLQDASYYVADLYQSQGYLAVQVDATLKAEKEDWRGRIAIREGPRYLIDTVTIALVDTIGDEPRLLRGAWPLFVSPEDLDARRGEPYQREVLQRDRRRLLRAWGNEGFLRAEAAEDVRIDDSSARVSVSYLLAPALPAIFDTLIIVNRRASPEDSVAGITPDERLRSLIPYRRGDTLRIDRNDAVIEKLRSTRVFTIVRLEDSALAAGEPRSALRLLVEERVPGRVQSSLFYDTRYGPGVSLELAHRNIGGSLKELRLGGSLALVRQSLTGAISSPLLFGQRLRLDQELAADWHQDREAQRDEPLYGGDFAGTSTTRLSRGFGSWLQLSSSAEFESRSRLTADSTSGARYRERGIALNFVNTAGLSLFLDRALDPDRGLRHTLVWGNGGAFLEDSRFRLAEFRHNWLELRNSAYHPLLLRQLVGAVRLDGGRFFGEGGLNSDRFFLGGPRNLRAFEFQEICPDHVPGVACRTVGLEPAYYLASGELRVALFDFGVPNPLGKLKWLVPLQTVFFVDQGQVWDLKRARRDQPEGRGIAVGWGLRYPLFGIFRLRLDHAIGEDGRGRRSQAVVIDLAQAF